MSWEVWGPAWSLTVPPATGDLTWVNQGSATASSTSGGLVLTSPAQASYSAHMLVKSSPTPAYTFEVGFIPTIVPASDVDVGILIRESGSGKWINIRYTATGTTTMYVYVSAWSSPTSWSTNYVNRDVRYMNFRALWFKIANDTSDRTYSFSTDGFSYIDLLTHGNTTFITEDQIGIYASGRATYTASINAIHWKES